MTKAALLFSGYNQRSVIALCRYFSSIGLNVLIVSSGENDSIYLTEHKKKVVLERSDSSLDIRIFEEVAARYSGPIVYCPTSEYLNNFVFQNRDALLTLNIEVGMPSEEVYSKVTNKRSSLDIVKHISGVRLPKEMSVLNAQAPCVIKPHKNIVNGNVLYPIICHTDLCLSATLLNIESENYFAQEFINGQSYYLCGCLSKDGNYYCYWQENLLQQNNGKSIVLARTCENPGLNESLFFKALHSSEYYGIIMAEFIKCKEDLYYIEINPRFWGPFQLALDHCDKIMDIYMYECFDVETQGSCNREIVDYYAWYYGAQQNNLKEYPNINYIENIDFYLEKYDVYNRDDSIYLHKRY